MQRQHPVSLVMRPNKCFYCAAQAVYQSAIIQNYGILACPAHLVDAKRDCNAYLHGRSMVRLSDAKAHPAVGPFFQALAGAGSFSVVRTSGKIDHGWSFRSNDMDDDCNDRFIKRDRDGLWAVPVAKISEGIERGSSFASFLVAGVLGITSKMVDEAVAALEAGLYADDAPGSEEKEICAQEEPPGVHLIVHEGELCRAFIHY